MVLLCFTVIYFALLYLSLLCFTLLCFTLLYSAYLCFDYGLVRGWTALIYMAASRVVPRTPQRSQLLDSQTKHDLLRLTVQQTRGPISRLRRRKKKEERTWASPSVALCRVVPHTTTTPLLSPSVHQMLPRRGVDDSS